MYTFENFALILCLFLVTTGHCRHIPKQTIGNLFKAMSDNCTDISMPADELQVLLDQGFDDKTNTLNEYLDIKIELLNVEVLNQDGTISKINKTKTYRLHADTSTLSIPPNSVQHQPQSDKSTDRIYVVKTETSTPTTTKQVKPQSEKLSDRVQVVKPETTPSTLTKRVKPRSQKLSDRVQVVKPETTPLTTPEGVKHQSDKLSDRVHVVEPETTQPRTITNDLKVMHPVETSTKRVLKVKDTKLFAPSIGHNIVFEHNAQRIKKVLRMKKSASEPEAVKPPPSEAELIRQKCKLLLAQGIRPPPGCGNTGINDPWT